LVAEEAEADLAEEEAEVGVVELEINFAYQ
jgi:hypothetical protein